MEQVPNKNEQVMDKKLFSARWWSWFYLLWHTINSAFSGTVVLAKITPGGTNGSLTVVNGLITKYTAPT